MFDRDWAVQSREFEKNGEATWRHQVRSGIIFSELFSFLRLAAVSLLQSN